MWGIERVQKLIDDQVQESSSLEYKSAGALDRTDSKLGEITKDVSAMANSSGGVLLYGVKEYDEDDLRHLPKEIDPVDQIKFSREWLDQVIGNIKPRIKGLLIHPVSVPTDAAKAVYVVEIPQSDTAHQARDKRYYRRYNFESVAMEDYEIRDVMHRASHPQASVDIFLYKGSSGDSPEEQYRGLRITVRNEGVQVINRFKLTMIFSNVGSHGYGAFFQEDLVELHLHHPDDAYSYKQWGLADGSVQLTATYQPDQCLFPGEELDLGSTFKYAFPLPAFPDDNDEDEEFRSYALQQRWAVAWRLFADSMPYKEGSSSIAILPIR